MISTYPKDIYESLEFNKVVSLLRSKVLSQPAFDELNEIPVYTDIDTITRLIDEVDQYKKSIENDQIIPLSVFESLKTYIPLLKKQNYVLSVEAIKAIYQIIYIARELKQHFKREAIQKKYHLIHDIVAGFDIDPRLLVEIDRVLDNDGEVKPDASPELLRISRQIKSEERSLDKAFSESLTRYKQKGYLGDSAESIKNGRRVLTVSSEHKRKIDGVVHDESDTGKTVFIEPGNTMVINNTIFNLYTERKKEIYKILKELCNKLRPHADELTIVEDALVRLDIIRAKTLLAISMKAERPELVDSPHIAYKNAVNPILYLKNKEIEKETVPFTLELYPPNRIIVISGPNAGGKSVTMKTVGVLQLMLQAGMLVSADANSKFGVFSKIFADIGDQQSLEDDLSTYSGRLKNMKHFLEGADSATLIIIDEFGSGTDPKIGGAIAEAILRELNFKKCYGIITTHYSNLKYFAFKTKGLVNGSMEFDKSKLDPTYQLVVGKPGSSFAFEIAQKIGLSPKMLNYAKHKTGKNEKAIDELLTNLQSEKKEVETKLLKLMSKEEKLDKLVNNYEGLHRELEFRRKKLKLEKKEHELALTNQHVQKIEDVVKELRKEKKLEEAEQKAKEIKANRKKTHEDINQLNSDIYGQQLGEVGEINVGDQVKMIKGDSRGEVLSVNKKTAVVQMGILKLTVPLHELTVVNKPLKTFKKSVNTDLVSSGHFESKLDLRGYKKKDAQDFLQEFLDKALIHNAQQLKIIHGVGNGVLSRLVRAKVKEYRDIKNVYHPEEAYGGTGVTIIEF